MTRQHSPKICTLDAAVLFLAVLTALIAFAAPAQQAGTGQSSAKSSVPAVPMPTVTPAQARLRQLLPETGNAQGIPATRLASVAPNSGSVSFLPVVTYDSGGSGSTSIAVADVNGDGKPDVVVANCIANGSAACGAPGILGVLLGNGDGTFQPVVTYSSGGNGASSVAIADVNGDGKPDLVVANYCGNSSSCSYGDGLVGVLLGNGDGTFQPGYLQLGRSVPRFCGRSGREQRWKA